MTQGELSVSCTEKVLESGMAVQQTQYARSLQRESPSVGEATSGKAVSGFAKSSEYCNGIQIILIARS